MNDVGILKQKNLIVCGIVRNAERGLRKNIPVIQQLCSLFADYRVVMFENDSKDATKHLLSEWQDTDRERIHVFLKDTDGQQTTPHKSEVTCNPFFSEKRISKMAALRNQYLDYIEAHGLEADYLMVVDLDVRNIDISGVLSSFITQQEWDVVTAFGYSISPKLRRRYHDTYALTELGEEKNPQTETQIKRLAEKYGRLAKRGDWVSVFSAFGGLAIYRFDCIRGLRYHVLPNNDERVEVHCEHFSLYWQMASRGKVRVFINPSMVIKYQGLSWGIILRSIRRRIGI